MGCILPNIPLTHFTGNRTRIIKYASNWVYFLIEQWETATDWKGNTSRPEGISRRYRLPVTPNSLSSMVDTLR
jgi:hypothetical protein